VTGRDRVLAGFTLALLAGCSPGTADTSFGSIPNREDLALLTKHAQIHGGFSDTINIDLPDGVEATLIEVRGGTAQYKLGQFTTPSAVDLVESGLFVTRDSREVPGLVDWLFPNSSAQVVETGRYQMRLSAVDGSGHGVNVDDVEIRLYAHVRTDEARLHIDIMLLDGALASDDLDATMAELIGDIGALYQQVAISIADYTVTQVASSTADISLDGSGPASALTVAAKALRSGRGNTIHLVLVRSLSDSSGGMVAGYSLGLPGPYERNRPNAAVMVATAPFESPSAGGVDISALAVTCAHEIGHYLGLYHTSERDGQLHDPIPDTPECWPGGRSSCPDATYVMNWTGGKVRNKLSDGQGVVMRRDPFAEASDSSSSGGEVDACSSCDTGTVCASWQGSWMCLQACDSTAESSGCPDGSGCVTSDDGVDVCQPS
jgi:hypothetical protein